MALGKSPESPAASGKIGFRFSVGGVIFPWIGCRLLRSEVGKSRLHRASRAVFRQNQQPKTGKSFQHPWKKVWESTAPRHFVEKVCASGCWQDFTRGRSRDRARPVGFIRGFPRFRAAPSPSPLPRTFAHRMHTFPHFIRNFSTAC